MKSILVETKKSGLKLFLLFNVAPTWIDNAFEMKYSFSGLNISSKYVEINDISKVGLKQILVISVAETVFILI